jgi:hypothetical protein
MFWRRTKPAQEEDHPLVPHGFLWQATDDEGSSEPPVMPEDSRKLVKHEPTESLPLQVSPRALETQEQISSAPEKGKISPPLNWPRVAGPEVARRSQSVDTAVSFPYRKPLVSSAVPVEPVPAPEPPRLTMVEPKATSEPTTPPAEPLAEKYRVLLSRLRTFGGLQRVRATIFFASSRNRLDESLRSVADGLSEIRAKSRPLIAQARLKTADSVKAALYHSGSGLHGIKNRIRSTNIIASGPARFWQRAGAIKVKVRVPRRTARFIPVLLDNAKTAGVRVGTSLHRESRLWMSMGMAALSALLALGVISTLRHSDNSRPGPAQGFAAAETVHAGAAKPVQQGSGVPAISAPASSTQRQRPSPVVMKTAPEKKFEVATRKSSPTHAATAHPAEPKRKVRRISDEDDYVAKDTTVYYGNLGKSAR